MSTLQNLSRKAVALLALTAVLATACAPAPKALTKADVTGRWASAGCETVPGTNGQPNYLTRDFNLSPGDWTLKLTIFGDPGCSFPLFSMDVVGPYTLGKASATVAGATESEFDVSSARMTALAPDFVKVFNDARCGAGNWVVGTAQDVRATGCIGVAHKASDCPAEYDLLKRDGDKLFFGDRSQDMCKAGKFPAAVGAAPVVKK